MTYEVMNKVTGVTHPVTHVELGETEVKVTTEIGEITFSNIGQIGDLQNEEYAIRTVGDHLEADGTGVVEDVVPAVE